MGIIGAIILLPVLWLLLIRFEGQKPEIVIDLTSTYIGKVNEFSISFEDKKSGLRKIWIALVKNGKEVVLSDDEFPSAGLFSGGKIKQSDFLVYQGLFKSSL